MFGKPDKKKTITVDGKEIELQPKPGGLFGGKTSGQPKPAIPMVTPDTGPAAQDHHHGPNPCAS